MRAMKTVVGGLALMGLVLASALSAQDEAKPAEPAAEQPAAEATAPAEESAAPAEEGAPTEGGEAEAQHAAEPEKPTVPVKPRPSEIVALASKALLLDVVNTGEHFVAVGDRGIILVSNDGKDWAQVQTPVRAALTAVHFPDAKNGWAVGHDATILHTADGGKTWAIQNFQPELEKPFLDVYFFDANKGLAIGAYGLYYQTADAGKTWTELDAPAIREEELHFNAITRLGNGDLFLIGESGMIAVSKDQGTTWERLQSPYESSLFGAQPAGEKGAIIYGLRGNAFIADDVRGQWRKIETGTVASMFGGTALKNGSFVLVGLNGIVVETDGSSVRLSSSPVGKSLSSTVALNGAILAVGEAGTEVLKLK